MAPEQRTHPDEIDHRADIYSLGVVLYQMLTGELPGADLCGPSTKVQIDVRLDEVVLRALEAQPGKRYEDVTEFKTRVEEIRETPPGPDTDSVPVLLGQRFGVIRDGKVTYFWGRILTFYMIAAGLALLAANALASLVGRSQLATGQSLAWALFVPFGLVATFLLTIRFRSGRFHRWVRLFWIATGVLGAAFVAYLILPNVGTKEPASTDRTVSKFDWAKLEAEGQLLGGELVTVDGRAWLKVENTSATPLHVKLMEIDTPDVTAARYAISGTVRYENVEGAGYLELWSVFPPDQPSGKDRRFFSRTMGSPGSNPMSQISGTSGSRPFTLPFDRTGLDEVPVRLEFGLVLPGRGTVFVGSLALTEQTPAPEPDTKEAALSAAERWLAGIDAGRYGESWDAAAPSSQDAISREDWIAELKSVREPLGTVIERELVTARVEDTLPGFPRGSYLNARFATKFAAFPTNTETVEFRRMEDGQWRAILYTIVPEAAGAPDEKEKPTVEAAERWLAGIDAGDYAESWREAAPVFRDAITEKKWIEALASVRRPLGKLLSRTVKGAETTTSLPGVPDGKHVVMQFDTAFEHRATATETVVFSEDETGATGASGYLIK